MNFKKQLFDVMKKMPMFKQICKKQFIESKRNKKSYTKARVGTVILGISFVISLILAWQVSIYILIASAILLAILIIYLIALKKSGFECTKIFCCCMDVEDEPQKENSKDNNFSHPKSNEIENLIK